MCAVVAPRSSNSVSRFVRPSVRLFLLLSFFSLAQKGVVCGGAVEHVNMLQADAENNINRTNKSTNKSTSSTTTTADAKGEAEEKEAGDGGQPEGGGGGGGGGGEGPASSSRPLTGPEIGAIG